MENYVRTRIDQGIGRIEFFHPQSNAMPSQQLHDLASAIETLGHDSQARVIVLSSAGDRAFCAGASFDELVAIQTDAEGHKFFSGFAKVINAMRKAPKFVVVRVQGKAVGGGVGIAAAGDYTLATNAADIKLSELAIGIGPFVVGPAVERRVGVSSFAQLAINASSFQSAQWASSLGLYNELHEDISDLDAAVEKLARSLSTYSPEATAEIKKMLWTGTEDWDQLLNERAKISGRLVLSEFTRQAIQKFKLKS